MTGTCNGAGGGGPGVSYSFAELEGLWVNAGGSTALAPTMAAVALAESGGCSTALNPTDNGGTQTSWGLWQISNGTHSSPGPSPLTGPGNAALAVAKWKSQGLSAWGTFDSGAYKQFLNGNAPPPDTSVSSPGGSGAVLTSAGSTPANPDCLLQWPSGKVLIIGQVGGGCIVDKAEARGAAGVFLMLGGASILALGTLVLVAYGLRAAGAGRAAGRALEVAGAGAAVAGADGAAAGLTRAGSRVRSQGASRAATSLAAESSGRRQARRAAAARRPATSRPSAPT